MVERSERTANARDRETIGRQMAEIAKERREEILLSAVVAGLGLIAAAVVLYLNRPVSPWLAGVVAVVLVVAIGFGGPTYSGWRRVVDWEAIRQSGRELARLGALQSAGRLHVMQCTASAVVAIGDDEDDVDAYVFQLDDNQLLVLPSWAENEPGFPSSTFEIVSESADFEHFLAIHSLGAHLKPGRPIDRARIKHPAWPDPDMLIRGRLADLS